MKLKKFVVVSLLLLAVAVLAGCESTAGSHDPEPEVKQVVPKVAVDANGMTVEQLHVKRRVEEDNRPGAIKYLYVISPFTGDVILQSTVKGKVTSSGKRLLPAAVSDRDGSLTDTPNYGMGVDINGIHHATNEIQGDDGTYGHSVEYIYWWDANDRYQQTIPGVCLVQISSAPLRIKKAVINLSDYDKPH